MKIVFYVANALVLPPAMHFAWHFYKNKGADIQFSRLRTTIIILAVTAVVTSLQFVFPDIIPSLNRNRQAMLEGEWWRLITPLFIQPMGVWQCVFNGIFFLAFVPIAEHLYGRGLLLIYFGAAIVGQATILYWETTPGGMTTSGGGSSTALYGVMGALYLYVFINRILFPKGYLFIPLAGFLGAVVLIFFEDGHAPALLTGALIGLLLRAYAKKISPYPQVHG